MPAVARLSVVELLTLAQKLICELHKDPFTSKGVFLGALGH